MSDQNEADAVARLEQALERIATLAARPAAAKGDHEVANPANSADQAGVDVASLAGRLDALIAELRGSLAG